MRYLLDTHVWIWIQMHVERLSSPIRSILTGLAGDDELLLSAISPWEFSKLLGKGRLTVSCEPESWIREAVAMSRLRVVPLDPIIAYRSTVLPRPFHNDPADQIIVATAREEDATILTADKRIRSYRHVKSLW